MGTFNKKLASVLSAICEGADLGVLYHGTLRSKLPSIMKDGLDPKYVDPAYPEDEEANDDEGHGPPYEFIYLSTNPGVAGQFAGGGDYSPKSASERAVLQVTLPPELQRRLITNRGEFIRCPFAIPPEYIKVV